MLAKIKIILILTTTVVSSSSIAIAQTREEVAANACHHEVAQKEDNISSKLTALPNNQTIKNEPSNNTGSGDIVMAGINVPNLWWARKQFDPFGGKLINNWLTHPQLKQIDLTVNWRLWTLLDYLGRYRFINQFGTVAREHGYDLRVFNQQNKCLAIYQYNDATSPPKWEIQLGGLGQDSLQVKPVETGN